MAEPIYVSRRGGGRPERWFVLGHEASNSGAPRMLLRVLEAARGELGANWECEIVLRSGGPLLADFTAFGPVRVLGHPAAEGRTLGAGVLRKFLVRPWLQPLRFKRWLPEWQRQKFDLVYNNSATNGEFLRGARQLGCPIVTHVHELGACIRRFNSPAAISDTMTLSDRFIAVSAPVAEDLVALGASADRIAVVPNFLPVLPARADANARADARRRLQLAADAQVVVACGHIDAVKGPDLFLEVAVEVLRRRGQAARFYWLGGVSDVRLRKRLDQEVRRRGLMEAVRFIGYVADPQLWYAASDVVTVTSRAESFSLVALEAAALGRPVVGFTGARGLVTLLGGERGLLAPDHATAELASRVQALLCDGDEAERVGLRLRERVAAEFLANRRGKEIVEATLMARVAARNK